MRHILVLFSCLLLAPAGAFAAPETHDDPKAAHQAAAEAAGGAAAHGDGHDPHAGDAHGGDHHGEGGGGLPQFDPSSFTSQIFWLVIAFLSLYAFFSKKTLPDIARVLKRRDEHVRSTLEAAKRQKEVAEGLQRDYERDIEKARQEATNAFAAAEKSIKERSEKENRLFHERAAGKIGRTEDEIGKAKTAAMEDMQHLAAEIASQAAEKIIGIETDIDQAKTVVRSLKAKAA